ncbi:MAG: NAD(P)/FAD-dependent oxidoreductase [Alphaproteobacteria bacterium]|nr:MAG: NAD(P)/FAD-dependent oxidoreductase [Alphaproteobacteria bacterium]
MTDSKLKGDFDKNAPPGNPPPTVIKTDAIIIGAGPVGLFAVLELGMQDIQAHIVDVLDKPGGQCAELYPDKPIYDIPALPGVTGQELVDKLMAQVAPFNPVFHLGEMADNLEELPTGGWRLTTNTGTVLEAPVVVIAAGCGAFTPKKPSIPHIADYEGTSVFYSVRDKNSFKGKKVLIAGGGDSALDWALELEPVADKVNLIHRRDDFRGAPDSVNEMRRLVEDGKINLHIAEIVKLNGKDGKLESVTVQDQKGQTRDIECDVLLPFYGLNMKLGPLAKWGLNLDDNQVAVDTAKFQTSSPGIFAIGDINTYPGKRRIILSGFHEAALMAHAAFPLVYPNKKPSTQHSTASRPLHDKITGKEKKAEPRGPKP